MSQVLLRGKPIGDFKGVLFDKDGTLSNSEDHLIELARLRIKEVYKSCKNNNLLDHYTYKKINHIFNIAYGLTSSGLDPNGLIAIASRKDNLISTATLLCILGKSWPNAIEIAQEVFIESEKAIKLVGVDKSKNTLLPGVLEVLKKFETAEITCALISNDSRQGITNFLKSNDIEDKFVAFWSADDNPSKPNPTAVKQFCKLIKLEPEQCLFIGDSDSDLKMARQAGVGLTLGYTAGWTTMPKLTYQQELIYSWHDLTCKNHQSQFS
tara:strand:+ start:1996 stop:2796 length:801 start_codon:yes stop_codon:yes gene_type:complete